MAIERTESRQTTCNAIEIGENGERKQVASATCSIRPGKAMTFSVDLIEGTELGDDDLAQIARMFDDFLAQECGRADALGIPILPKK